MHGDDSREHGETVALAGSRQASGACAITGKRIQQAPQRLAVAQTMKKYFVSASWLSLLLSVFVMRSAGQETNRMPETVESLQKRIATLVTKTQYNAGLFGVKIVSLDTCKTIYEHDAEKLCSPASNSKLYTMGMALDRLGPNYRIKTSLYAKGKPDESGTLKGDLVVYGRGDPTINVKLHGNSIYQALQPFV